MKLTTAEKVLERMNLSGTIGSSNTTSIDSALEAATSIIESVIRTPLKASSRKDYYDYSIGRYDSFKPFYLWLSQRFVQGKIKIYISQDGNPIRNLADAALLTTDDYIVDSTAGKVTILKDVLQGNSVIMVKYSAGYRNGATNIPDFLQEAAISAAVFMNHSQSIAHGKKDAKDMTGPLAGIVYSQLNEFILTPYQGQYPVNTVVG